MAKNNDTQAGDLLDPSTAIESLNRSEIDMQISTAKAYPRDIDESRKEARKMALVTRDVAGECFYTVPRAGKSIRGPSVRLAEIWAGCWGNLRYGSRIIAIDERFVTAQGACHDLEKNISGSCEVKRRITDKHGRRFSDDMIQTTCNAAASIALREAIFKVIPRVYVNTVYNEAMKYAIGNDKPLSARVDDMLAYFAKMGVVEERVLARAERASRDQLTDEDLVDLKGLATAIRDGDTSIDDAFGAPVQPSGESKPSEGQVSGKDLAGPETDTQKSEPDTASDTPDTASDISESLAGAIEMLGKLNQIGKVNECFAEISPRLGESDRKLFEAARDRRIEELHYWTKQRNRKGLFAE